MNRFLNIAAILMILGACSAPALLARGGKGSCQGKGKGKGSASCTAKGQGGGKGVRKQDGTGPKAGTPDCPKTAPAPVK